MIIDCDSCIVRDIACRDCVVSVLVGPPEPASALDPESARVIDLLASRGMVPPLRFEVLDNSQQSEASSG